MEREVLIECCGSGSQKRLGIGGIVGAIVNEPYCPETRASRRSDLNYLPVTVALSVRDERATPLRRTIPRVLNQIDLVRYVGDAVLDDNISLHFGVAWPERIQHGETELVVRDSCPLLAVSLEWSTDEQRLFLCPRRHRVRWGKQRGGSSRENPDQILVQISIRRQPRHPHDNRGRTRHHPESGFHGVPPPQNADRCVLRVGTSQVGACDARSMAHCGSNESQGPHKPFSFPLSVSGTRSSIDDTGGILGRFSLPSIVRAGHAAFPPPTVLLEVT